MQYWVISNFRLIWSYLGVLSTHTHASNIKKPLCQPRIQVKIPLKPGSTTLSRTHWHTDNICMQIPQSLGPTTLSPPILVTSNPQKYPNMERWSVHPFFFGVWELSHVEPALFVWSKSSRQFKNNSHRMPFWSHLADFSTALSYQSINSHSASEFSTFFNILVQFNQVIFTMYHQKHDQKTCLAVSSQPRLAVASETLWASWWSSCRYAAPQIRSRYHDAVVDTRPGQRDLVFWVV